MAAPVALSSRTDSGPSSTWRSRTRSNVSRTCPKSLGRGGGGPVSAAVGSFCVGSVNRIQHAPENVALERQRRHGAFLLVDRPTVFGFHLQGVLRVAGILLQPCPVVGEA